MGETTFIPFNGDPVSTTGEATTYALAAGKYARVTPTSFGAPLVIDGDTVLRMQSFEFAGNISTSTYATTIQFTGINTGFVITRLLIKTASGTGFVKLVDTNGVDIVAEQSTTSTSYGVEAAFTGVEGHEGATLQIKSSSTQLTSIVVYVRPVGTIASPSFYASGGAGGITITGDQFTVELYNSVS